MDQLNISIRPKKYKKKYIVGVRVYWDDNDYEDSFVKFIFGYENKKSKIYTTTRIEDAQCYLSIDEIKEWYSDIDNLEMAGCPDIWEDHVFKFNPKPSKK